MSEALARKVAARRQAAAVASLRRLAKGPAQPQPRQNGSNGSSTRGAEEERCDLCQKGIPADHRHLLHIVERQILCVCESCLALRSGDAELRPTGTRIVWLDDFELSDEVWANFEIPIGLAFLMLNASMEKVVALYPSPAGATESELDLGAWGRLRAANPALTRLEPDIEALIVNRMSTPHRYVIAPIDECYRLVGLIKVNWDGISGGTGPERVIEGFFEELRAGGGDG